MEGFWERYWTGIFVIRRGGGEESQGWGGIQEIKRSAGRGRSIQANFLAFEA